MVGQVKGARHQACFEKVRFRVRLNLGGTTQNVLANASRFFLCPSASVPATVSERLLLETLRLGTRTHVCNTKGVCSV